ncbi:hypothetical protein EAG_16270 [Camponotus floridanus]|uniref:Uncharacterized protein n=1 Tax=Camponotus floridanus TaxID=104421 RepID=E2AG97_CAMFO|nr:hypothetical protein EAG_16270 [Camponotus floridanus]
MSLKDGPWFAGAGDNGNASGNNTVETGSNGRRVGTIEPASYLAARWRRSSANCELRYLDKRRLVFTTQYRPKKLTMSVLGLNVKIHARRSAMVTTMTTTTTTTTTEAGGGGGGGDGRERELSGQRDPWGAECKSRRRFTELSIFESVSGRVINLHGMVSRPNDSHWNDDVSTQHDCPLPQPASPMVSFRSSARDCVRQACSKQASRSDNHSQTYQRATDALPRNQRAKLTYRPTDKSSLKTTVSLPFLTQAKLDRAEAIRRNGRR